MPDFASESNGILNVSWSACNLCITPEARTTLIRRGNELVAIDPPGRYCPLYQRQYYRVDSTRWRKIERFVSDQVIHW